MGAVEPAVTLDPTRGIWKESRPLVPPRYYVGTREKAEKYQAQLDATGEQPGESSGIDTRSRSPCFRTGT